MKKIQTTPTQAEQIAQLCIKLNLGTIIPDILPHMETKKENVDFLEDLLVETSKRRDTQMWQKAVKKAGLDPRKTLELYNFGHIKWPDKMDEYKLRNLDFIDNSENLILFGEPGTGKTHLASGLGIEACRRKKKVAFFKTAALVSMLSELHREGKLNRLFLRFSKLDLLILDEWGYVPLDLLGSQLLFRVVGDCYEKRSVILTTNLSFTEWNNIFHDKMLTNAILDRMVHHTHFLSHEGESYRIKHSMMKN